MFASFETMKRLDSYHLEEAFTLNIKVIKRRASKICNMSCSFLFCCMYARDRHLKNTVSMQVEYVICHAHSYFVVCMREIVI